MPYKTRFRESFVYMIKYVNCTKTAPNESRSYGGEQVVMSSGLERRTGRNQLVLQAFKSIKGLPAYQQEAPSFLFNGEAGIGSRDSPLLRGGSVDLAATSLPFGGRTDRTRKDSPK